MLSDNRIRNIFLGNVQPKCYFTVKNACHLLHSEREQPLPVPRGENKMNFRKDKLRKLGKSKHAV